MDSSTGAQMTGPVEVIRGEVRIGKELNAYQNVLKEWFYTCYVIGTIVFLTLHLATWGILQYYWYQPKDNNNTQQYYMMGEQQQQQQPYNMDPSFGFVNREQDDGFESLDDDNGNHHGEPDETMYDADHPAYSNNNGNNNRSGGSDDYVGDYGNSDDWEECSPEASSSGAQNSALETDNYFWNGPPPRERPSSNSSARVVVGTRNHRVQRKSAAFPHGSAASPRNTEAATQPPLATRMSDPQQSVRFVSQGRTKVEAEEWHGHDRPNRRKVRWSTVPPNGLVQHENPISRSVDDTEEEIFMDCLEDLGAKLSTSAKLVSAFKSDGSHAAEMTLTDNVATAALSSCPRSVSTELTNATSFAGESNGKGNAMNPSLVPLAQSHQRMLKRPPEVFESALNEESLCEAILKVPEAQVLDSFLADMINPFVR
jgi:hypothetical protein